MDEGRLTSALDRAERALAADRARAPAGRAAQTARTKQLRAKVREAVAELDQLIRMAENA